MYDHINPNKLNPVAMEAAQDAIEMTESATEVVAAFLNALLADDKAIYSALREFQKARDMTHEHTGTPDYHTAIRAALIVAVQHD